MISNKDKSIVRVRFEIKNSVVLVLEGENGQEFVQQCDGAACAQAVFRGTIIYQADSVLTKRWIHRDWWSGNNVFFIHMEPEEEGRLTLDNKHYENMVLFGEEAKLINAWCNAKSDMLYETFKSRSPAENEKMSDEIYEEATRRAKQTKELITEKQALQNCVNEFNRLEPGYQLIFIDGYEACIRCESISGQVRLLWDNSD